jgi:hypothetical protein
LTRRSDVAERDRFNDVIPDGCEAADRESTMPSAGGWDS